MSLAGFHFIRPYWLLAVIPYMVILLLMLRHKLNQGNWAAVCDAALLPFILQEKPVRQSRWQLTSGAFAALLAIIALAGPTWERLPLPVFRNDSALVIALDLSRSMDAKDIKPSRLTRARYKIADILKRRKDGQTALLVYAGDAFTVTPLTNDTETIESQLSALNTDIMPNQGSNTSAALQKAVELFKQAGLQKGWIMLVTDGVDPDQTLATVKSLNSYRLSILGIGTPEGAPIALPAGGFLKDEQGNIVIPRLNSNELMKLAQAGNGSYQSITANDVDIETLLSGLDEPTLQQGKEQKTLFLDQWEDKGPWLLLLVLPLAALTFRKGLLGFALLLLLPLPENSYAFDWQDLWQTKDQQAQQAYKNKHYDQAAQLFENPDWKAASYYRAGEYDKAIENLRNNKTATGFYNQGNALAQAGKLEDAIKAYEKALTINPDDEDAKYNKAIVEKELKKQQQNQQKDDKQQQSKENPGKDQNFGQKEKQDDKSAQPDKEDQKKSAKESEQQQSDKQPSSENRQQPGTSEEKKEEGEKTRQAEPQQQDKEQDKPDQQAGQISSEVQPKDETEQANEQWLKRIPDDPAGLLKRKFKYQYGQREHQSNGNSSAW
ncbi:von Willebrand factor type A [Candidatus Methylobacter favarea]|uniref:von Willebrand factor type A n=2 Tax=Candidatus Methylobacter favarea TaxID=2707345 RepID=A0A8S0WA16_9GAMM|nr:VWA domain-containing protein [Candidatus Methylobacter favarea]CAA9890406.1 von Willebrand factor type A [Candidatus Methylobacter favarea]